jgi:hypothetical protein
LFKYNAVVTNFSYVFDDAGLSCSTITNAAVNWPGWNVSGVNMTYATDGCKK